MAAFDIFSEHQNAILRDESQFINPRPSTHKYIHTCAFGKIINKTKQNQLKKMINFKECVLIG